MLRLKCIAQNYDWGIKGSSSTVGRLYALGNGQDASPDLPYAELWMGTHPSGPSEVLVNEKEKTAMLLREWLKAHPEALGDYVQSRWKGELPFLFKVLSVAKALSIQAHPDKELAEKLHASQPKNYKDDNHKPEMALAVTPFETLCGFVSSEELKSTFEAVPELKPVVGEEASQAVASMTEEGTESTKNALKIAFRALMTSDKAVVEENLTKLIARLQSEKKERTLTAKEELILRIEQQYPGDVGVFSAFFLNYFVLAPGEAVYLAANEPHAYLQGECIECMAASDNVVRAGLTPKYRDTDTLCSMLTYKQGLPEILKGTPLDACTSRYTPPFEEFEIFRTSVPVGGSYTLPLSTGPSIFTVFKGNGAAAQTYKGSSEFSGLKVGDIFFIPAGAQVQLSAVIEADIEASEQTSPLELYRATVNGCALV
eukprot:jgi/Mesen1/6225/ME000320S05411